METSYTLACCPSPAAPQKSYDKNAIKSDEQWREYWLSKYSHILIEKGLDDLQRRKYWAIIRRYLQENPGNPRTIAIEKVKAFVQAEPNNRYEPLELFYSKVTHSPAHLELLQKNVAPKSAEYIRYATALQRICWNRVPTFAIFRNY